MFTQPTVEEIEAYATRTQVQFPGYLVFPNSYGIRAECPKCHESATLNPEMWMRNHRCAEGRPADFEEVTINADGTRDRKLYFL